MCLGGLAFSLLELFQGVHSSVKSMSVVPSEFRIGSLQGRISIGLWFLDTIPVRFRAVVMLRRVLRLGHYVRRMIADVLLVIKELE